MSKTLYVDSLDKHETEENCICIHPAHLKSADCFDKACFDKIVVKNSKADLLTGKGFFNLCRALKTGCVCEVFIDQPIAVMQKLDAGEIEANAKLGGFSSITQDTVNITTEVKGVKNTSSTIKLSMNKP